MEKALEGVIHPLTESDIPAAMELKNALGWNQTPKDWARFLRLSPGGCFKAVRNDELAGTAVAYVFDRTCWIGMVIVGKDHRRRGLGRRLMERCLEHGERECCRRFVLDGTSQGAPLYASLGFREAFAVGTANGRPRADARQAPIGPEPAETAGLLIRRMEARDLDEVAAIEAGAQGADRRKLFEVLLEQNPGRGFVCADRHGELEGFVMYRPGHHSTQIGPLVARGLISATGLLRSAFSDTRGNDVTLTIPLSNGHTLRLIEEWGLEAEPRLNRMCRGSDPTDAGTDMIYVMSGPEKG